MAYYDTSYLDDEELPPDAPVVDVPPVLQSDPARVVSPQEDVRYSDPRQLEAEELQAAQRMAQAHQASQALQRRAMLSRMEASISSGLGINSFNPNQAQRPADYSNAESLERRAQEPYQRLSLEDAARERASKLAGENPNSSKSRALQELLQSRGYNADGLDASTIKSNNLLYSADADLRNRRGLQEQARARAASLKAAQEGKVSDREYQAGRDEALHGYKMEELAAKRHKGGGGAGGPGKFANFTPENIEKNRATFKANGYTDSEIEAAKLLPADKAAVSLSRRIPESQKPGHQFTLDVGKEKKLENFTKRMEPIEAAKMNIKMATDALGEDSPGFGTIESNIPDFVYGIGSSLGIPGGAEGEDARRTVGAVISAYGKAISGTGVSEKESIRLAKQVGVYKGASAASIKKGMEEMKRRIDAQEQVLKGGYADVIPTYNDRRGSAVKADSNVTEERVPVMNPQGKRGTVPKSKLEEKIKQGYKAL